MTKFDGTHLFFFSIPGSPLSPAVLIFTFVESVQCRRAGMTKWGCFTLWRSIQLSY